nr:branched-chain amino acid aminotransferase [bacterium]
MEITVQLAQTRKPKPQDESKLGFGKLFTDHMFVMEYDADQGWHDARIVPYDTFQLSPASSVLHYGQSIFEGLKAYRRKDGGVQIFRQRDNFERMNRSAARMCMPQLDVDFCEKALIQLLKLEEEWVPHSEGTSLYIRPTMVANDATLGVHAAHSYIFYIILSPVGAYYAEGLKPVKIFVENEYVRAVKGGTGFAKTAANYAASILAGEIAARRGYAQVLWLDGKERRYVEEVGSMNIMFVIDGTLVSPALQGSILPGITRDSVLKLAKDKGMKVEERPITIQEVFDSQASGKLQEVFGTGTAAVISPVSHLDWDGNIIEIGGGEMGPVASYMYDTLTGIQFGAKDDPFHWITRIS